MPAEVWLDDVDRPERVRWGGRGRVERVECVLDSWCVDDAWWSERPVRRVYHELQLEGGVRLIAAWDMVERCWMVQR